MKKNAETPKAYDDREVLYLISLIKSAIRGTETVPVPEVPEGLNWQRLYNIAERHMVTALVYQQVKLTGCCPADLFVKWKLKVDHTLKKELQFDAARGEIFDEFEKNGIDYLPLKGIIIKDFYPRKGLRQFSDNDILIRKKDMAAVDGIMKGLSYECGEGEEYDPSRVDYITVFSYNRDNLLHFEIHNALFYLWQAQSGNDFYKTWINLVDYFNKTWERAKKCNDKNHAYYLSDEDFYIYTLAHFYKHYRLSGGAGFRSFADFYLIRKNLNLDRAYIEQCFHEAACPDLELFEKEAEEITDQLFGDRPLSISDNTLLYIVSSGAYGTFDHQIDNKMEKSGKFVGYFKMTFPSLKVMQVRYNVLIKAPVLLPVFYVVRIFSILFTGSKRTRLKIAIKKFFSRKKDL